MRRFLRRLVSAVALVMAAQGAACKSSVPRPVVGRVTVASEGSWARLEALGIGGESVRRGMSEALRDAGFRVLASEGSSSTSSYRASVTVLDAQRARRPLTNSPREVAEERVEVAVVLRLEVPGSDEGPLQEAARWSERVRVGEPEIAAIQRALKSAAYRAATELMLGIVEAAKSDAAVIADLDSADLRLRDHAVRVLADRNTPQAVPALIARLRDPDPELVERAVGALDQMKDPRAVEPLIELSHRREGPIVAQLARIIGDIGGPEAYAYLLTLASGHPEPLVRQAAEQALVQSRERRGSGERAASTSTR